MTIARIANPTVKAAVDALQSGKRQEWAALFEPDAELFDDGRPRSLESFTRDALGHEHFVDRPCGESQPRADRPLPLG